MVLIRGANGNFCAGGDFAEVERLRGEGPAALSSLFEAFRRACDAIAAVEVPVVAAVEGVAAAGGFELMQAADIVLVSDDARIADNHVRFGMIPGGGSTQRLPRLVGRQQALGLLLSGERLSGADAARLGLAYHSFPASEFDDETERFVATMAGRERSALVAIKRLVVSGMQKPLAAGIGRRARRGRRTHQPRSRPQRCVGVQPTRRKPVTSSVTKIGSTTPIALDVDGGIARLRLNRPEVSNGLNVELLKSLHEAILACHADPKVRVVLLTGEGRNFCAGGDIHTFESKGADLPDYLREATAWLQLASAALIQLRVPVVTAVQGFAAGGGGLGLVCASDIVVAAESAKFFSGAVRVGMAPDGGVSVTLTQLVGLRQALRIVLTNPTLTAAEALAIGLITEVAADDELQSRAEEIAEQLVALPTQALSASKRLVWNGVGASVEQRLAEEARTVSELSGTADALEGLRAVIERRPPRFQ